MFEISIEKEFDAAHFLRGYQGKCEALQKSLGCDRRPVGKQAVKVGLAQTGKIRQCCQVRLLDEVFIKIADNACNALVIIHAPILPQGMCGSHPIIAMQSSYWLACMFRRRA